jgi:hypothetical protein
VAAISGAVAQLVATVLEPDWSGDPAEAARVLADSEIWTGDRLLDLVGLLLTVTALTVVGRTFAGGTGEEWARLGQPFLVLTGALGAGGVLAGATLKDVADAWAGAAPEAKQPYLSSFDTLTGVTEALFFGAFMALGAYLAALSAATLVSRVYARWIGRTSAAAAVLISAGNLLVLVSEVAFLAVLAGFLAFMVVLIALGISMWRRARWTRAAAQPSPAGHVAVTSR